MKRIILMWMFIIFLLAGISPGVVAQQTEQKFVQEVKYLLYLPDGYTDDTTQRWPVLLFLHGSGESGTDLNKVKVHGPPKLIEQGKKFPFIVISPQAQNGWRAEQLMDLLRDTRKNYRVDNDRLYVTGLSMGGFGSWDLATKYPGEFAAIAPIGGGGKADETWKLRNMAVWCFHGAKDNTVPLSRSEGMVNELKKYNPAVKFTIYPEAGHDSWTETYNNDSLYSWLLAQKRHHHKQVDIKKSLLNDYAGIYLSPEKDSLTIEPKEDLLIINLKNNRTVELKPFSENSFFIEETDPDEIRFSKNSSGKTDGFTVWAQEKTVFKKIMRSQKSKSNN